MKNKAIFAALIGLIPMSELVQTSTQQEVESFPTHASADGQWHDQTYISTLPRDFPFQLRNPNFTYERTDGWNLSNFNSEMQQGSPRVEIAPNGQQVVIYYRICSTTPFRVHLWADFYKHVSEEPSATVTPLPSATPLASVAVTPPTKDESKDFLETLQGQIVALTGVVIALGGLWAAITKIKPKRKPRD